MGTFTATVNLRQEQGSNILSLYYRRLITAQPPTYIQECWQQIPQEYRQAFYPIVLRSYSVTSTRDGNNVFTTTISGIQVRDFVSGNVLPGTISVTFKSIPDRQGILIRTSEVATSKTDINFNGPTTCLPYGTYGCCSTGVPISDVRSYVKISISPTTLLSGNGSWRVTLPIQTIITELPSRQ